MHRNLFRPLLVCIPSLDEVDGYNGDNTYYCGLEHTSSSIQKLLSDVRLDWSSGEGKQTDPYHSSPRLDDAKDYFVSNAFPDVFFELAIFAISAGAGTGVYNLLRLWIEAKNGRRIHVKLPSGLEIDATQMNQEEFSQLVAMLHDRYVEHKSEEITAGMIKNSGMMLVSEKELLELRMKLQDAVVQKQHEIEKRLSNDRNDQ